MLTIKKKGTDIILGKQVKVADRFFERMIGLMFSASMKEFDGLLIKYCNSVHTCFMRYKIDVVYLDKDYKVIKIIRNMKPWRMTLPYFKAIQTLELAGGSLSTLVQEGDVLEVMDV